jgi:branched-chain amino acid transport system ATP-binding protein
MTYLLEARGLSKRFGGVLALDGLDLHVAANEILGLIGPNGSGKTTFFNVVTGLYGADAGSVTFDGADMTQAAPRAVYQAGISRTFHRSRLSLPLSIFDNIIIGNHKRLNHGLWFNLFRRRAFQREF